MSKPWTIPRWWPLTQTRQAVVGFKLEFWFFPEFDQWKFSFSRNYQNNRILAIGPLRFKLAPIGINRSFRGDKEIDEEDICT